MDVCTKKKSCTLRYAGESVRDARGQGLGRRRLARMQKRRNAKLPLFRALEYGLEFAPTWAAFDRLDDRSWDICVITESEGIRGPFEAIQSRALHASLDGGTFFASVRSQGLPGDPSWLSSREDVEDSVWKQWMWVATLYFVPFVPVPQPNPNLR
jgi:hypothetical protein